MKTRSTIAILCLVLLAPGLAAASGSAGIPYSQTFSGTSAATQGDLDGLGGDTASILDLQGTGDLGPFSFRAVSELDAEPVIPSENCAEGEVELGLFDFAAAQRVNTGGDLIYYAPDPAGTSFFCADPAAGTATGQVDFIITGGTERAAGASGSARIVFAGEILMTDADGNTALLALNGTMEGVLIPAD